MDYANQFAPQLRRFLARQIPDAREAQDLMQEVYLRILTLKHPGEIRSPKAYLYRVAANLGYQHRLSCNTGPKLVPFEESEEIRASLPSSLPASDPEAEAELRERLDEITERLNPLPLRVRSTLLWHYRDGYTCEEIGERLSIRRNRVKKYIARAMARCRGSGGEAADSMTEASLAHSRA